MQRCCTVLQWPCEKPTNYFMPMASHSSIHSLATTNKTELVWHLAHRPELKLSYITICVHRNNVERQGKERRKLHDIPLLHTVFIMHVHKISTLSRPVGLTMLICTIDIDA